MYTFYLYSAVLTKATAIATATFITSVQRFFFNVMSKPLLCLAFHWYAFAPKIAHTLYTEVRNLTYIIDLCVEYKH